eukprot:6210710-Pleurochrysis_carterae.AAC.1
MWARGGDLVISFLAYIAGSVQLCHHRFTRWAFTGSIIITYAFTTRLGSSPRYAYRVCVYLLGFNVSSVGAHSATISMPLEQARGVGSSTGTEHPISPSLRRDRTLKASLGFQNKKICT